MKMRLSFSLFFVILVFNAVSQSEKPDSLKKISLREVYISGGLITEPSIPGTLADFQALAPSSELLTRDFTGFEMSDMYGLNSNSSLILLMGFRLSNKEKSAWKRNPFLRTGIFFTSRNNSGLYYYRESYTPYDTLVSSQSGTVYYVDSVKRENYWMNFNSKQLRVDASMIFRTNEEDRWSLFGGFGFCGGFSLSDYTTVSYTQSRGTSSTYYTSNSQMNSMNFDNYQNEFERHDNKTSYGLSLYIPMGIDFRAGKRNLFWRQVHFYYELRPGIGFNSMEVLGSHVSPGVQQGLGLRIKWNETIDRVR